MATSASTLALPEDRTYLLHHFHSIPAFQPAQFRASKRAAKKGYASGTYIYEPTNRNNVTQQKPTEPTSAHQNH